MNSSSKSAVDDDEYSGAEEEEEGLNPGKKKGKKGQGKGQGEGKQRAPQPKEEQQQQGEEEPDYDTENDEGGPGAHGPTVTEGGIRNIPTSMLSPAQKQRSTLAGMYTEDGASGEVNPYAASAAAAQRSPSSAFSAKLVSRARPAGGRSSTSAAAAAPSPKGKEVEGGYECRYAADGCDAVLKNKVFTHK